MITIKFEAEESELLQEFHQFIYDSAPNIVIDEHYEMSMGMQKEPIVTAIIARITGAPMLITLQAIFKDFMDYKKEKSKQETQRALNKQEHTERLLGLYLNSGGKWDELNVDDFVRLRIDK